MANIEIPESFAAAPARYAMQLAPKRSAAMMAWSIAVYRDSNLPLRLFEAIRARVALINGCQTCQRIRAARDIPTLMEMAGEAPSHGVHRNGPEPDERLYLEVADWRSSDAYTPEEKLGIEFAERFSLEPDALGADGEFWTRLRATFTDAEIYDMTDAVAYFVGAGRLIHVLGLDQTTCDLRDRAPVGSADGANEGRVAATAG